jgi:hypothetical protein
VGAVNQALNFGNGFRIASANNRFVPDNVPVDPDEIRSVFRHCSRFLEVPVGNIKNAIRLCTFVHKPNSPLRFSHFPLCLFGAKKQTSATRAYLVTVSGAFHRG